MVPNGTAWRASRRIARCLRISSMDFLIFPTRSRILRRSVSSFFSPSPPTPIPPPPPRPAAPPRGPARAATASSAAFSAEARHFRPMARQPRQKVIELRQLDLQLAFAAARVPRKNIQNELRAVNDAAFGDALNVSLLHG